MGFSRQEYWSGVQLPSPNKVIEYKVNIQKSIALLQISNEQVKFEIKNNSTLKNEIFK